MRKLIRTDGVIIKLPQPLTFRQVEELIKADILDTVLLKHMGEPAHVMLVDDLGHAKDRPVNPDATLLYWLNCRKDSNPQPIVGDVVVCPDADFEDPMGGYLNSN